MSGARVVIIGRNGQLSRSLSDVLKAANMDVVNIGRPEVDITDRGSVRAAVVAARPTIVVNAAAYTAVDRAEEERDLAFAVNAAGARSVAEAAAEVGATVIHVSTDYVFDGTKNEPYVESDPVSPLGVYGESKLEGERLVADANPRHVILRTAWVFSPFAQNFAKTMLRLNQERPKINVVDDQRGCPTYAPDLAEVVRLLIARLAAPSSGPEVFGTFHAVNSGETTWYEFASAIIDGASARGAAHAAVHPIGTKDYPTTARRPAYSVLSTGKLSRVHRITMRPWSDALPDALNRLVGPVLDTASKHQAKKAGQSA